MTAQRALLAVRPGGAVSCREWGEDRHRLIHRTDAELREIARETLKVRTELHRLKNIPSANSALSYVIRNQ